MRKFFLKKCYKSKYRNIIGNFSALIEEIYILEVLFLFIPLQTH
jgi:hypothetical protein